MEQQISEYYKALFLFVQKRVRNRADAEDLTQEVVYKLLCSNTDAVRNVQSWMYAIARNTIIDYYRKKKIPTEDMDRVEQELADTTTAAPAWQEISACITPFIAQLPEEYRTVIQLSEIEGVPQKEIAQQLGIHYTTLRSKVQRGRKKLRRLIAECCTVVQGRHGSIMGYQCRTPCAADC